MVIRLKGNTEKYIRGFGKRGFMRRDWARSRWYGHRRKRGFKNKVILVFKGDTLPLYQDSEQTDQQRMKEIQAHLLTGPSR